MIVHLFVMRISDGECPWIVGAWDDWTVDANPEGFAEDKEKHEQVAKKSKGELRVLKVEIPDSAMDNAFKAYEVGGEVVG